MLSDGVQVGDIFMLHRGNTVKEYYIVVSPRHYPGELAWNIIRLDGFDDSWELENTLLDPAYYRKVA